MDLAQSIVLGGSKMTATHKHIVANALALLESCILHQESLFEVFTAAP